MDKVAKEFWITNISKKDIFLYDLNVTIRSYCSINLLNSRHYNCTVEQINKSVENGSIFKKRYNLICGNNAPNVNKNKDNVNKQSFIPNRSKSIYEIKNENYEELELTDEQFAEENADIVVLDTPSIKGK